MKKFYLLFIALLVSAVSYGQLVKLQQETFGTWGFYDGAMNAYGGLTSDFEFTADKMRIQTWSASFGYDEASGSSRVELNVDLSTDTISFKYTPLDGFENFKLALGVFSYGAPNGQFDFEYSYDSLNWTLFDESSLLEGDRWSGSTWQKYVFSEDLNPTTDLFIKIYRTSNQVFVDDIMIWGEPADNNAYLESVDLDVGEVTNFEPLNFDLEAWVPYGTTETPVITANAFATGATVTVTSEATDITSANEADRTSTIEVVASDNSVTNVYNVVFNVTPPRTDATISSIDLSYGTLAPEFSSDRFRYLVELPDTATMAPSIDPLPGDNAATFTITGPADISSADVAERTASIEVVAQDGVTSQTYEIVFEVGNGSSELFVIDYETFGDEGNKFDIVLSSYAGFTSDWEWGDQNVHIRTSNPSSGYDLASGFNRIEVQAAWGQGNDTLVFMADASQFSNVTLATGIYNNTGADIGASAAFKAYYSVDSMNWTSIGTELVMGTEFPGIAAWSYIITDDVLPTDDSLYIMFANEDANFEYYLDDITLWGTPLSSNNQLGSLSFSVGTLDPAFDPTVTEYVLDLPQFTSETPTATYDMLSPDATAEVVDATDVRSDVEADRTTTITVTAENGDVQTYTIVSNVYMSSDATLAELSAGDNTLSPVFDNDIAKYAVKLPAGTTEAPTITATPNDDVSEVTITDPADITSSDVAERTATIDVVAEDGTSKHFEIVYTFGSLSDLRFNLMQEKFLLTGTFDADLYAGYTSGATFDGDAHQFSDRSSEEYPLASGGAAIKFGNWGAPLNTELTMKYNVKGFTSIKLSFGIVHESEGWPPDPCNLTNNFTIIEYSTDDGTTWTAMDKDSLTLESADWPCGGQPFSFVDLAEELETDDQDNVMIRITHSDPTIHPFFLDDIVISGVPISADASLFDLSTSVGGLDPLFDPAVTDYTVDLPIGTTDTPVLTAVAMEDSSEVEIMNAVDVTSDVEAERTSTVMVTAPDGVSMMTYSVVFNVLPNNDPTLSALSVAGDWTLDPAFAATTFDYEVELTMGTTETPAVTATPTDPNATVDVTDAADVTAEPIADRTTEILVTAEDGTSTVTYTILFTGAIVSAKDAEADMISVYPNPTAGKLYISKGEMIKSVRVTNMAGQVIMSGVNTSSAEIELDVSDLSQGYYNISIETNEGDHITRSFIKN